MKIFSIVLLCLASVSAAPSAEEMTLPPGWFIGLPCSLLTATAGERAWIRGADEDETWKHRKQIGKSETVRKVCASLLQISFSKDERELLVERGRGTIGAERYEGCGWLVTQ